ncbi:hypothetical protein Tco_1176510 [Tanacetum coccineum]
MGLWYPKDNAMSLTAYADADHAGCHKLNTYLSYAEQADVKIQEKYVGKSYFAWRIDWVSWSSKKQRSTEISTQGIHSHSGCCATNPLDAITTQNYGFLTSNKIPLICDNKSAIATLLNNVHTSRLYAQSTYVTNFHPRQVKNKSGSNSTSWKRTHQHATFSQKHYTTRTVSNSFSTPMHEEYDP